MRSRRARDDLFGGDDDGEDAPELKINSEFARRFEHNKRREELHRLQEKHPEVAARLARNGGGADDDDSDEESTSEDLSEGELTHPREDEEMLRMLVKIKNKDPSIYNPDTKFYSEDVDDDDARPQREKKRKPTTLRSVIAERVSIASHRIARPDRSALSDQPDPPLNRPRRSRRARKRLPRRATRRPSPSSRTRRSRRRRAGRSLTRPAARASAMAVTATRIQMLRSADSAARAAPPSRQGLPALRASRLRRPRRSWTSTSAKRTA